MPSGETPRRLQLLIPAASAKQQLTHRASFLTTHSPVVKQRQLCLLFTIPLSPVAAGFGLLLLAPASHLCLRRELIC